MALGEGSVLGGYRIVRLIGRGGMGAVYLADDVRLGRKVALKVLATETAENPAVRDRFVRESQVAASLDHPHILPIYEAGEADGQLFIAMRYVPGPDLDGVIARDGPLPLERTVALIDQIGSALDAAHAAGLIHRDVKPGNILVAAGSASGTDHAYLTDFGLTKHAEYSAALTRSGQLLGSVGYVAPEVIENRPIDGRVDIYSLGCVLYECLAGSQPYPRDTEVATLYAHVQAPAPSIAGTRPELPATIDGVIAKAMAKAPEARYQSGAELARALTEAATPDAPGRHLTRGFLFADLRGYTAYVEAHGDQAGAALLETYRRLVRDVVRRSGGAEIKTEGDSFYVVFPSASEAVRCGLAITAAAASASTQDPNRPIAVGVGIHAGETAETAEGYVGSAGNLAARICAQAAAGEVLVSDTVRGLARTSSEVSFVARGRRRLKGIAEPIAVFAAALVPTESGAGGPPPRRPSTTSLAGFGMNRRRRSVVAIAGAVAGIALGAWLVASAVSGGLRASPAPSFGARASQPLVQTPQSIAPSPASYGVIAFVRSPDIFGTATSCDDIRTLGQGNILIMRDDGSDVAPVTSDLMGGDVSPAMSPDGTSIAFVGSDYRFRAAALTGANRTELSVPGPNQALPGLPLSWSPDGRQFAYLDDSSGGTADAYIANADGSDPHLLWKPPPLAKASTQFRLAATGPTPGPRAGSIEILTSLDWMHDGRVALLISTEDVDSSGQYLGYKGSQLDAITADGKTLSTLAASLQVAGSFDVSPDGSRIAISGSVGGDPIEPGPTPPAVDVMNIDGTNVNQLTHDPGPDEDPVWSPDGSQVAFSSWNGDGAQIEVVPSTGGRARALTQPTPDVADCQPSWRLSTGPLPSPAPIAKGDASDPISLGLGALRPGTYTTTPFKPTFQIDLPAGWEGVNLSTDGLYLWRKSATRERLWVSQVQVVFAGDCITSPTRTIGPTALDFVNWIRTDKDLRVGTVYPTSVGGATGLSIQVSVKHVPGQDHCQPIGYKTALYPISNDQVALQIDDVANFLVLDVNGTRVVLTLFGTAADLNADSAEITALLGSIRFP